MGDEQQATSTVVQSADGALASPMPLEQNDEQMDIHKPKPVHSWRELLSEIGVIVIGVLIALGAEQLVEAIHWQEKVSSSREALYAELGDAYYEAAERIIQTPCLNAQLDKLKDRVINSRVTLAPAPTVFTGFGPTVYRHSARHWNDTIWQSTMTEQVSSHLERKDRHNLANIYSSIAESRRLNSDEMFTDGQLNALANPLPLDPSLRGHFVELIEAQRTRANQMKLLAIQQMKSEVVVFPELRNTLHSQDYLGFINEPKSTVSFCRENRLPIGTVEDNS